MPVDILFSSNGLVHLENATLDGCHMTGFCTPASAQFVNVTIVRSSVGVLSYPLHVNGKVSVRSLYVSDSEIMMSIEWNPGFPQSWLPLTNTNSELYDVVLRNVTSGQKNRSVFLIRM